MSLNYLKISQSIALAASLAVAFLKLHLDTRKQGVFIHGRYSEQKMITFGVPLGSVLGPVLFCLFINDLPEHIEPNTITCSMLADDTPLISSGKIVSTIEKDLQNGVNSVSNWCKSNKMALNPSKIKCMLITTRQKHQNKIASLNLTVNSEPTQQVSEHCVLGVIIDDQLK